MKILFFIFLVYVIGAFFQISYKKRKSKGLIEWVPREYWDEFFECNESAYSLFDKGEEIPSNIPTLLIVGNVITKNKSILFFDYLANLMTFGYLRFSEIIPVNTPLSIRLYFKNISEGNFNIECRKTNFYIKYPEATKPSRKWNIDIPSLSYPGDCRFVNSELFFCPEVPGTHEFGIYGFPDLVYAGPYGVSGRRYRIANPDKPWLFRFHVSTGYEYRVFIIAFFALLVAIVSLILTLIV